MMRFERRFTMDDEGIRAYHQIIDKFKNYFGDDIYMLKHLDYFGEKLIILSIVFKRYSKDYEDKILSNGFIEKGEIDEYYVEIFSNDFTIEEIIEKYENLGD